MAGTIYIEPNRWQLISVPTRFGYWDAVGHALVKDGTTVAKVKNYIIDQLEDKYGAGVVEVANTYYGDDDAFRNFDPLVTPESSPDNFPLAFEDPVGSGNYEYSALWIRSLHNVDMELEWEADI